MRKSEFLAALRKGLNGLPQADIDASIEFYSEMIDDRMEDGLTSAFQISVVKGKNNPAKESIDSCRTDNKKGSS